MPKFVLKQVFGGLKENPGHNYCYILLLGNLQPPWPTTADKQDGGVRGVNLRWERMTFATLPFVLIVVQSGQT